MDLIILLSAIITIISGAIVLLDMLFSKEKNAKSESITALIIKAKSTFFIAISVFAFTLIAKLYGFPALLVALVFVSGVIWLLDSLFWKSQRQKEQKEPTAVEYSRSFFPIILAVLVIRSFIAEPFQIPSGSMLPTLRVGDFILVNKFSYGVRLPVINTKIISVDEPQRGDVMVFRYPKNPSVNYIKRVVGLPGDTVGYFNKIIYINGEEITQTPKSKSTELLGIVPMQHELREETLGEHQHELLVDPSRNLLEGELRVPEGHYFVMGDNRDNSNDSRVWGTVPEENLVGKAFFIWMSLDGGIVWNRIGNAIK